MERPGGLRLAAVMAAVLVLFGGLGLLKGGLYIARHEGDTLHLLDIVLRMAAGERIHQDFVTPIGVLAFAPIVLFISAGLGAGHAMLLAQVLTAALLLPMAWWACRSRLSGGTAMLVGSYIVLLPLALVYGEVDDLLSMSMHYNRWSWALAYVALILAVLPPRGRPVPAVDGVIIGLCMAALALTKATYFIAFAVPVVLALTTRGAGRTLAFAVAAGLAVALAVTAWGGLGFWQGYIANLAEVQVSEIREEPGYPLADVLAAPKFLVGHALLIGAVVLLRQAGQARAGLLLLLLAPGFVYVTYQNFGNDPQWLILLAALLLTLPPEPGQTNRLGLPLRRTSEVMAVAVLALAAPAFLNLAYSTVRHFAAEAGDYLPVLPDDPRHSDLLLPKVSVNRVDASIALDTPGSGLEQFRAAAERKDIVTLNGQELRICTTSSGLSAWMRTVAADLEAHGFGGRRILEADLLSILHLFGDFPPLRGAAPWYYGGAPGLADAELVLVPDCPLVERARRMKLVAVDEAGMALREVYRAPLFAVYRLERPQTP